MPHPEIEVPRAMVGAIATGLVTAFLFLIALLFCITDINEVRVDSFRCLEIFHTSLTDLADRDKPDGCSNIGHLLPGNWE